MRTIYTYRAIGQLLDWTPWKPFKPVCSGVPSIWAQYRERRLMFGEIEAASIVEYQMHSGICQYIVNSPAELRPRRKFDSYEQAFDYLSMRLEAIV